jgi:solute carrier family 6 GABA transporter-like protein 6/8/11/12/13
VNTTDFAGTKEYTNSENYLENCRGGNKTHPSTHLIQPAVDFWEKAVLNVSNGIEDGFMEMNWPLFVCLVGCWVFIYFCLWKGVKSTGKVVWVTATAPFVLIMVFLVRALTLPNAMIGVRQYLQVDMDELAKVETWMDAGTQIFWSFSICLSAHTSLGSYNKKNNNVFAQCVGLGFLNSFTSFISGFVVFGVLGFMSAETGLPIAEVVKGGPGLAFIVYPKAITLMPGAKFWGATFFVMIFLLGIDSQFVCTEGIVTSTCDLFPEIFQTKEARKNGAREKLVLFICCCSLMVGIPMIMRNGIFVFTIFDFYSASGVVLLTVSACQCIAVGWSYGGWKFYDDICEMMEYVPVGGKFMPFAWIVTAPGISIATLIVYFIQFPALEYTFDSKHYQDPTAKYTFPRWTQAWGLCMSAIPAVLIIGVMGNII